jgi:hypothetical protein
MRYSSLSLSSNCEALRYEMEESSIWSKEGLILEILYSPLIKLLNSALELGDYSLDSSLILLSKLSHFLAI